MKSWPVWLFVLVAACGTPDDPTAALDEMVEAERAFARASEEAGMRPAFLEYLAPGALLLRPAPTDGRAYFEAQPETPGTLSWQPAYAEIAGSAEFGYTTGPWTFFDSTGAPVSHGHYVSVWRRRRGGAWRVVFDAGIAHGIEQSTSRVETIVPEASEPLKDLYVEAARVNLLLVEKKLAVLAAQRGLGTAFGAVASDSVRVYRPGGLPRRGTEALLATYDVQDGVLTWVPVGAGVAASGTLGYTYGLATRTAFADSSRATSSFFRLWRRTPETPWQLLLDLAVPIPPEAP